MGKTRGFTLIELMVTITVFAIIAMMAAPSFGNMVTRQKLNLTTRELVSAINQAKSRAALMKNTVALCLSKTSTGSDFDKNACATAIIPGYTALTTDEKTEVQNTRVINVSIDSNVNVMSTSATTVLFNDVGSASTSAVFSFCKSKNQRTVSVTRLGIITQASGTCP